MYVLNEIDLAGNCYPIFQSESFEETCEKLKQKRTERPTYEFLLTNPDNTDVDWPDGLTDEEWENLP